MDHPDRPGALDLPTDGGGRDAGNEPVVRRLLKDRTFQFAALALLVVVFPYLLPFLSEDQQWWWDNIWVNLLLYGSAFLAAFVGVGRIESPTERRFWRFLSLAMGSILTVYVSWGVGELAIPLLAESVGMELFSQLCYLAYYLFLAFAIDSVRTLQGEPADQELRRVRAAGLGVLFAGLMAYFAVTPVLVYTEDPLAWTPILLIYASLDAILCLQALRIRAKARDARWRRILGWFALALAAYAAVDFLEAADYAGWIPPAVYGFVVELQWYIPILIFILGARIHLTSVRTEVEEPIDSPVLLRGGPLSAYLLALPLLHFLLYSTEVLDPELRVLREVVVLAVLFLIGTLTFLYQRKVQNLNRIAHEELQASRERYSSFVDTSVEGIWLLEFRPPILVDQPPKAQLAQIFERGVITESNDSMAVMYGFETASEIEGIYLRDLLRKVKHSNANARATMRFVSSGYRVTRETLEFVDPRGNQRYAEGSLVGTIENGYLVRAWATQVDVTSRYLAEAEKEKLEQQLRRSQRLETIGTLAGGIAHDFNNILSPILGFADLAEHSVPPEDTETRECLGQIKTAAVRAKELVSQILAVGQRRDNVREPVVVKKIVEEALGLLRKSLPSTVIFETEYAADCPSALADPGQLHQIVMNLCTNAQQSMEDSKGTIRLEVKEKEIQLPPEGWAIRAGKYVTLSVRDNGRGMSGEVLNRALEPFYTTKEFGTGSGLGLSVTHGIIRSHGGHIELESEEGVGTVITIYLQVTGEIVAEEEYESTSTGHMEAVQAPDPGVVSDPGVGPDQSVIPEPGTAPCKMSGRVMLVDDDASVANTCERMLLRLGYEVRTFTDSTLALEALESSPLDFDLLLTDHTMPEVTGPQLVEKARAGNPSIAVVVASGHRFGDEPTSGRTIVQLAKPYTVAGLRASVEEALGKPPLP